MKTYINETFFKVLNYKSWKTDIIFIKNQGKFKSIAAECKYEMDPSLLLQYEKCSTHSFSSFVVNYS